MRGYTSLLATALAFGLLAPTFAQQPAPRPQADDEEEVVRITTNLVQVDAVVTDRDGRHVTDLRPEDFEISEDGKAREISNFAYVNLEPRTPAGEADAPREKAAVAPAPSARARAGQTRRTVALIVDDLSLSYESS